MKYPYKHGNCKRNGKRTKIYQAWTAMKQRCLNKNASSYYNYGGRGITICKEWMAFPAFYVDMGEPPSPKHILDRIDNDKGYFSKNCRWVTHQVSSKNKRSTKNITYRGKTQCLSDWSKELGLDRLVLRNRIYIAKWSIKKAFTTPISLSNGTAKLNYNVACAIRELYKLDGIKILILARRFRVTTGTISAILCNKTWKNQN